MKIPLKLAKFIYKRELKIIMLECEKRTNTCHFTANMSSTADDGETVTWEDGKIVRKKEAHEGEDNVSLKSARECGATAERVDEPMEKQHMDILEMAEVLTDPAPIPVVEQLKEVGTELFCVAPWLIG